MKQSSVNTNFPKLLLYSGHDVTLVNILRTLGVTESLKPNFAAYLILELHHTPSLEVKVFFILSNYENLPPLFIRIFANCSHIFFQMFYSNCGWCGEKELKLNNCGDSCMLGDFEEQLKPLIPEDWDKECE